MVITTIDDFTDETRKLAFTEATKQPSVLYTMRLAVTCDAAAPTGLFLAVMDHPEFIVTMTSSVTHRVDSLPAVTSEWLAERSALMAMDATLSGLVSEMIGGERLLLRLRPGGGSVEFSLFGFAEAVAELACYTPN